MGKIKIILTCALLLCFAACLMAQDAGKKGAASKPPQKTAPVQKAPDHTGFLKKSFDDFNTSISKQLKLSPDQNKRVKKLQDKTLEKASKQSKVTEGLFKKYNAEKAKDPNSKATVDSRNKLQKSLGDLRDIHKDHDAALKKILTKNQGSKYDVIKKEKRSDMKKQFQNKNSNGASQHGDKSVPSDKERPNKPAVPNKSKK